MKTINTLLIALSFLTSCNVYGQCKSGNCDNGTGVYLFSSGQYFDGEFKNGDIFKGKLTTKDYYDEGTFINNKLNGENCKRVFKNQSYEGSFKNGVLTSGTLIQNLDDGRLVLKGDFNENSKLNGKGELKQINSEGEYVLKGLFINGKLNDKNGVIIYPDGREYFGEVKDNYPDGIGKTTYPSGGTQEGLYIEGEFQDGINLDLDEIVEKKGFNIPLTYDENSGVYYIEIEVNGTKIKTIFDTGAAFLSIDEGYLYSAKKDGLIAKLSEIKTRDANNNITTNHLYFLQSIKIDGHEAYYIPTIGKSEGKPSLFGVGVLKRLGSTFIVNLEKNYISILK